MKKLFALLLAITMMATLSVTAFAADYDTAGDKGMDVTYSVEPGYTVTIPPTVTIGTSGTSAEISAADVVVERVSTYPLPLPLITTSPLPAVRAQPLLTP